ncbi:sugar phosphate isomerase/epimerase [Ruminococcaceae bacterium OttesenSCG-928-I18]|nr:sugar phosphate isomerase/epimerase [Ruminococcaceae bacterium OttesenSCG-928-I18]
MKYGIYYAYWEKEWGGDYLPYIQKVKDLGFDVLEVACASFEKEPETYFEKLRIEAERVGITLTGGYGPSFERHIAAEDGNKVKQSFAYYQNMFHKMQLAGIKSLGGALYSYWPVDYTRPVDKPGEWRRSMTAMQSLADLAATFDITLNMEVINRFEGYLLNTAEEGMEYVRAVDRENVKIMLDTFHMNIEEDSLTEAIKHAGASLGELHVGEANRRPPREGRMDWKGIFSALKAIRYDGLVVMEPFVQMGGQVGRDIKVFRDLSKGASQQKLDKEAAASVAFLRRIAGEV